MCHVFLYAGWSYRDGTSLILSDEIGQIFIIGTGQGESQKDAKYDQVHKLFLDYHILGDCLVQTNVWVQSCILPQSQ
jgi:hypothetical protein